MRAGKSHPHWNEQIRMSNSSRSLFQHFPKVSVDIAFSQWQNITFEFTPNMHIMSQLVDAVAVSWLGIYYGASLSLALNLSNHWFSFLPTFCNHFRDYNRILPFRLQTHSNMRCRLSQRTEFSSNILLLFFLCVQFEIARVNLNFFCSFGIFAIHFFMGSVTSCLTDQHPF